jgi:undecaprenyl-diphosphatase
MSYFFAIILGLVQGITEFLPISSSGHLSVLQNLFGVSEVSESPLFFDTLLHLATLISICFVYWGDIVDMVKEVVGFIRDARHPKPDDSEPKPARRLVLMIIIATLPLFIALPLAKAVGSLYANTLFIGIAFLITGAMLYVSDRLSRGTKTAKNMTIGNALVIGVCQAVATLPGISRSGTTITAGMATGLDRSFAVKFSFLMSIPAVIGANILNLIDVSKEGVDKAVILPCLAGMAVAAVTGYFAIRLVKMLSEKGKFGKFCYYCFAAGLVTIVLSLVL